MRYPSLPTPGDGSFFDLAFDALVDKRTAKKTDSLQKQLDVAEKTRQAQGKRITTLQNELRELRDDAALGKTFRESIIKGSVYLRPVDERQVVVHSVNSAGVTVRLIKKDGKKGQKSRVKFKTFLSYRLVKQACISSME